MDEREQFIVFLRQRVVDLEKAIAAHKHVVGNYRLERLQRMETDLAEITARIVELTAGGKAC